MPDDQSELSKLTDQEREKLAQQFSILMQEVFSMYQDGIINKFENLTNEFVFNMIPASVVSFSVNALSLLMRGLQPHPDIDTCKMVEEMMSDISKEVVKVYTQDLMLIKPIH